MSQQIAFIGGLMRTQEPASRLAMADGLQAQIERIARLTPGDSDAVRRRAAIGNWSAMVGALILSRAVEDQPLSDEILEEVRAWLDDVEGQVN